MPDSPGRLRLVLRRLLAAAAAWAIQVLAITAVLDAQLEASARSMVREEANAILLGADIAATGLSPAEYKARVVAGLERSLGLDLPPLARTLHRATRIMTLDFGSARGTLAFASRRTTSVREAILAALPNTLLLLGFSTLLAAGLGISLGVAKARRAGSRFDRATSLLAMLFEGTPTWWMGSLLVLAFVYWLRLFPFGALQSTPPPEGGLARLLDRAAHFVLPVLSVTALRLWGLSLLTRNIVLPHFHEDYVTAARGMGLPEPKVGRIALRAAAPGVAATVLQRLLAALPGDVLVEVVFAFPGIGFLLWNALRSGDVNLAAGILATLAGMSSLAFAFLDMLHAGLDPRTKSLPGER